MVTTPITIWAYMVKDVTHENIWNGLDLALSIDSVVISCDHKAKCEIKIWIDF
jgi:hypothetical protein